MIEFSFNERKAAQAAAHLLRRHGNEMYYLLLIKLLYLADRQALLDRSLPITGDRYVSMNYGPVLRNVKDLVTMESLPGASSEWRRYVSEPDRKLVRGEQAEPAADELSEYEVAVLDKVDETYGNWDRFDLCDWTHKLREWRDPHGSSLPIDPRIILEEAGRTDAEIADIEREASDAAFIDQILSVR